MKAGVKADGREAKKTTLDEAVFGIEPNQAVLHQVVTAQLAGPACRHAEHQDRAEVRGGGAKPWKQKGTGRARRGSIRSPRSGVAAAWPSARSPQLRPAHPEDGEARPALGPSRTRNAEGKVLVIDSWGFDAPSTKAAVAAWPTSGRGAGAGRARAGRHRRLEELPQPGRGAHHPRLRLNAYDVLVGDWVIFTEATLPTAEAPARPPPTGPLRPGRPPRPTPSRNREGPATSSSSPS